MNLPDFSQVCDSRTIPCHGLDVDIGWVPKVAGSKFCKSMDLCPTWNRLSSLCMSFKLLSLHTSVRSVQETAQPPQLNHGNHRQARLTEGTGPRGSLVGNIGHTTHAPQRGIQCVATWNIRGTTRPRSCISGHVYCQAHVLN